MQLYAWLEKNHVLSTYNMIAYFDYSFANTYYFFIRTVFKFLSTTAMKSSIERSMSDCQCYSLTYCFRLSSSTTTFHFFPTWSLLCPWRRHGEGRGRPRDQNPDDLSWFLSSEIFYCVYFHWLFSALFFNSQQIDPVCIDRQ